MSEAQSDIHTLHAVASTDNLEAVASRDVTAGRAAVTVDASIRFEDDDNRKPATAASVAGEVRFEDGRVETFTQVLSGDVCPDNNTAEVYAMAAAVNAAARGGADAVIVNSDSMPALDLALGTRAPQHAEERAARRRVEQAFDKMQFVGGRHISRDENQAHRDAYEALEDAPEARS